MKYCKVPRTPGDRLGIAALWALVVLAIMTVLLTVVAWQALASRRHLSQRQARLQVTWLARAGVEIAAERLLHKPAEVKKETVEVVPGGKVVIEVQAEKDKPGAYIVTSAANYDNDGHQVVRVLTSKVRRETDKGQVRLHVTTTEAP